METLRCEAEEEMSSENVCLTQFGVWEVLLLVCRQHIETEKKQVDS